MFHTKTTGRMAALAAVLSVSMSQLAMAESPQGYMSGGVSQSVAANSVVANSVVAGYTCHYIITIEFEDRFRQVDKRSVRAERESTEQTE